MSWIERLFGSKPVEKAASAGSYYDLWTKGEEYLLLPGTVQVPMAQVASVYVAVDRISEGLTKIPMKLQSGENLIDKHPFLTTLHRASEHLRGGQLMYATAAHLMLQGEAFWVVMSERRDVMSKQTAPQRIRIANPNKMNPRVNDDLSVTAWEMNTDNGVVVLPPDAVVFFKLYNPTNEIRGLAPLSAARLEYELEWKSGRWNELFYEQGARPPFYVFRPPEAAPLPPHRMAEMREMFEDEYTGISRGRRVPFMPPGSELRSIGISQTDMDFLEGRRFSREQILSVFGVPPAVAGVFEYANYANSSEQKRYFWNHTLRPLASLVQDTVQAALVDRMLSGYEFLMDIDQAIEKEIPEDYSAKIEAATKLWALGIPLAAINERLELGFDVDEIEGSDVSFVPSLVRPIEQALEPPAPPQLPGMNEPDQTDAPKEDPEEDPEDKPAKRHKRVVPRNHMDWHGFKPRLVGYETAMTRRMAQVYHAAERHVLAKLDGVIALGMTKGASDELLPRDFHRDVQKATEPVIKRSVVEGGEALLIEMGRDATFDLADPNVQAAITRRQAMVGMSSNNFAYRLDETVGQAITDGSSGTQLRASVEELFDMQQLHLRTISRTETSAAFNSGRMEAMQQIGVQRHQWLTAGDERVRDTHAALDGAIAIVGTNDWEGGGGVVATSLRYPLDPTAPPGETINCRCVTIPVEEE
jgi:HK97 family phage portal protein